LETRTYQCFAM